MKKTFVFAAFCFLVLAGGWGCSSDDTSARNPSAQPRAAEEPKSKDAAAAASDAKAAAVEAKAAAADAVAGAKTGAKLTLAVIPKGTTHEFWKSVHAGAV